MTTDFPHLFSPLRLGALELKNRLVATPAGTGIVHDGSSLKGDHQHYERIAEGGVGLVITGAMLADPGGRSRSRFLVEAFNDDAVPSMAARAVAVHGGGAKIVGQIAHLGRELLGSEAETWAVAPSAVLSPRDVFPPHVLEVEEIESIVASFAQSAHHLQVAGYDGVELHGAHGYLIAQFMSRSANRRDDQFGGSLENRFRFTRMIVDAIRERCRDDFALGIRITAEEEIADGITTDEACRISSLMASTGAVDYVSVTHGVRGAYVKDGTHEDGVAVASARRIKAESGLVTLVAQRIRDPHLAENALRTGSADLVGMARALLADPDLPAKAEQGRLEEIRTCLGVNQDCRAFDEHLHCAVNAEIGRPQLRLTSVRTSARVFVIGGGPGGLEAARVAAERGHDVTLFESGRAIGGQLVAASSAPHRGTLIDVVDYLERQLRRLRVDVNLGAEIGVDDLSDVASEASALIIATGSRVHRADDMPERAVSVDEVLLGPTPAGTDAATAVVVDAGEGFWHAYSAAEKLAMAGTSVTLVTPASGVAGRIPHESVGPLLRRLDAAGIRVLSGHRVVHDHGVAVSLETMVGPGALDVPADLLVWHAGRRAITELHRAARQTLQIPVTAVGDCVSPRRISHAILEGYRAAAAV